MLTGKRPYNSTANVVRNDSFDAVRDALILFIGVIGRKD
jgi:hypothetical protein